MPRRPSFERPKLTNTKAIELPAESAFSFEPEDARLIALRHNIHHEIMSPARVLFAGDLSLSQRLGEAAGTSFHGD